MLSCSFSHLLNKMEERLWNLQRKSLNLSGMSISDSNIKNCNRKIRDRSDLSSAEKLWNLGKEIGVSCGGNEAEIITKIVEMEVRDREVISARGAGNGFFL